MLIVRFVLVTNSALTVKTGRIISWIFSRTVDRTRRKWFNEKLHEQHLRRDSFHGNRTQMTFVKRQVAMNAPVLKPVLKGLGLALDKEVGVAPSINIKWISNQPSKSTKCLIIQNSADEYGSTYEAEARSSSHSAIDCTSRSPATDKTNSVPICD